MIIDCIISISSLASTAIRYQSCFFIWHSRQKYVHAASGREEMCGKLNKCIYGLKQLLQEWYHWLIDFLTPHRFVVSNFDPCTLMFKSNNDTKYNDINNNNNNLPFIAVYVNKLSLFGPKGPVMDNLKDLWKWEFKVLI